MSDTEVQVSPLLGKYLNTMVADLDIRDKGQYLRDLFSKYETEAAYAAGSDSRQLTQEQARAAAKEIVAQLDVDAHYSDDLRDYETNWIAAIIAGSNSQREGESLEELKCERDEYKDAAYRLENTIRLLRTEREPSISYCPTCGTTDPWHSQREAPKEKVKCETTANADGAPVAARPVGVSVSSGNICATCGKPKFDPQTSTIASGSVGKLPEWYCLCDQREAPSPQLGTCREVSFPHEKDKHQWAHNHDPEDGPSGCIGWKAGVPPTAPTRSER